MGDLIVMKGNQDGLLLKLDQTAPLYEIHKELKEKLTASRQFFGNQKVILTLSGRHLLDEDATKLIELIQENSDLTVTQLKELDIKTSKFSSDKHHIKPSKKQVELSSKKEVELLSEKEVELSSKKQVQVSSKSILEPADIKSVEANTSVTAKDDAQVSHIQSDSKISKKETEGKSEGKSEAKRRKAASKPISKATEVSDDVFEKSDSKEHMAQIRYGTLRSGQELYFEDSVIYIGNIHVGAKIVAKGHIIVIGHLLGSVHAGYGGNYKAFVMASKMKPTQIRIGKVIARSPDNQADINLSRIAFVEDDHICIEEIDQKLFNDLSIIKS